ncbi:oligosaccharide flippase family protein [Psychrobium sp. 1_MG-2023]|uniref:oligosaccharide flippase family protein n=1 Tax=Psychrobium sp. 1_MG-2023 TaxID=3062624 RepID=UPI000C33BFD1|nr:oligosaccharide flippase family protein [Psychrobium sp. 1_MG-2023]MDP2561430.1 oligosaccharide flippase family protein [Psychrobium sp. 1_MG-2023]PKF57697.1 hypothetical protein CW748_05755 [Alteromonadales bacterium alter-6D02]
MDTLKKKMVKGSIWMLLIKAIERSLGIINIAILARLLTPNDFGIVAVAAAAYGVLSQGLDLHFDNALIQKKEPDKTLLSTAWTLNAIRGVIIACLLAILAYHSELFFDSPDVQTIIYVLALIPLIEGFNNIGIMYFIKDFEYNRLFTFTISMKFCSFMATVAAAFYLQSYWALIIGMLTSSIVGLILSYKLHPFRPFISTHRWQELFSFSIWLMCSNLLSQLTSRIDIFIINRWLGTATTGAYHIGQDIGSMIVTQIIWPLNKTLFPALSKIKDDAARHKALYIQNREVLIALGLPLGVGLSILSRDFTDVVLGAEWALASIVLSIVSLSSIAHIFTIGLEGALLSIAKTKALFLRQLIAAVIQPVALIAGVIYGGLLGLLCGRLLISFLMVAINLHLSAKIFAMSMFSHFTLAWRSIISTFVMVVVLTALPLTGIELFNQPSSILLLLLKVLIGASAYCICHFGCWQLCNKPNSVERFILILLEKAIEKLSFTLKKSANQQG